MTRLSEDALGVTDQRRVFRERLLARMREVNMRAADVARSAHISKDSVSAYVTMRALPSKDSLAKIARALKCKPVDLLPPGQLDATVMELREHKRPGYKILIVRAPLPASLAVDIFSRIVKQAEEDAEKGNGLDQDDD